MRKRGKPVTHPPILCVETGKVYDTYTEAAKDIGGSRFGVMKTLNWGQRHTHGFHFKYIKKEK